MDAQEQWYSPALDVDVKRKGRDPATGTESDIRIVQIRMGEPDASLFEIPKGYVQDKRDVSQVRRIDR